MEDLDISTLRYSEDKCKIDNYGKRLLSLCKSLDIHKANGRLGKDNKVGSVTCKNTSFVDYCILSPELFSQVVNFEVLPFHTGKCIRRFGGIYMYCQYFIDRKR